MKRADFRFLDRQRVRWAEVDLQRIVFNDYVNSGVCALFVAVVICMIVFGLIAAWRGYSNPHATAREAAATLPGREAAVHA